MRLLSRWGRLLQVDLWIQSFKKDCQGYKPSPPMRGSLVNLRVNSSGQWKEGCESEDSQPPDDISRYPRLKMRKVERCPINASRPSWATDALPLRFAEVIGRRPAQFRNRQTGAFDLVIKRSLSGQKSQHGGKLHGHSAETREFYPVEASPDADSHVNHIQELQPKISPKPNWQSFNMSSGSG